MYLPDLSKLLLPLKIKLPDISALFKYLNFDVFDDIIDLICGDENFTQTLTIKTLEEKLQLYGYNQVSLNIK